jgi:tRNA A37 threonylcarbamoyladenosine biosynthesis protein TsaE
MQEIQDYNQRLKNQRQSSSLLIGLLLTAGFIASIPMFSDSIKHEETLYCNVKSKCRHSQIKRGISYLVDRERRNQLFDNSIKVVKVLPPEDPAAVSYGLFSSLFLLSAYGVSKALTDYQEKSIHSQFKILKIKTLENDILEQNHLDLFGFSKSNQSEITRQVIARQTQETIQQLKSEGEVQLDHLNGQLQGQLSLKGHQLQLSELDKETVKNNLETLEVQRKIDKLNKLTQDTKQPTPDEQLKTSLIEALKQHEDGYLWTIINSLKPLWLIGNQGSGKTYTASAIALIRKYCLSSPIHYLIDRHATGDNADVWKFLKPENVAEIEEDIIHAMQQSIIFWGNRIKAKPEDKQQIIVDEFTNLRGLVGDIADSFFKLSLTDTRKAKCYLLGITHNASNSSFAEGTSDTRKAGMILIQKFSANGETPLPRIVVRYGLVDANGNSLEDVEKTLPSWFHPQKIHDHFNGKPINFEE